MVPAGGGVTMRRPRRSAWRTGPPKWAYTAYGVALATLHLGLAAADWRRAFDLWREAWPFYASLVAVTSAAATVLHVQGRTSAGSYYGGNDGQEVGNAGRERAELDYPRPSAGG